MRKRNVRGICAFLCTILLGCLIPAGEVVAAGKYDKIDDHSSGI